MTTTYLSGSEGETEKIAADLARRLPGGSVVLLYGELGMGKTAFVRGFVQGLGIAPEEVSSPTFTVIQEYRGHTPVYHVDLYRLQPDEVDDLGLEELGEDGGVVCIEWADRLPRPIAAAVSVRIADGGGDRRTLEIDRPASRAGC